MKILIGADIVPTKSNIESFIRGQAENIVSNELKNELGEADFRLFNLEVPLADTEMPIDKCGPNLIAPTASVKGIKELGVSLFTLANNHIMDHGNAGLKSTIDTLESNDIKFIGVGNNLSEAAKPYIIENDNTKVGIYACAEHEFSIADKNTPGANPFDALESLDHIKGLKEKCDYVVVLYHGGKEYYRYPSPYLQKVCRKMCDKGADLVVCQHSHCIGSREHYNGAEIVYGQGNFIYDDTESVFEKTSLLVKAEFEDEMTVKYIPLCKNGSGVCMAEKDDAKTILKELDLRSEQITQADFIKKEYHKFALNMRENYIKVLCGSGFFFRILNKLCGHKLKQRVSKKRILAIRNYIECEAHRELMLEVFGGKSE